MQVWKFRVGTQTTMMPAGATIIHAASQDGKATVWALVDPAALPTPRAVLVKGTGQDVPDGAVHLGSYMSGPYVWHVFEMPAAVERAWTEWSGGEPPVVGSLFADVEFRNGHSLEAVPVAALTWQHQGEGADIVRYREAPAE